jgi:transposase
MRGCARWWPTSLARRSRCGRWSSWRATALRDCWESSRRVEREIKAARRQARVLHHDETRLRVGGAEGAEGARLQWTQVTCTPTLTQYAPHAAPGATALEAIGILPGFTGVSVHDGWTSYRHLQSARHARCNAHHLREVTFVHEDP